MENTRTPLPKETISSNTNWWIRAKRASRLLPNNSRNVCSTCRTGWNLSIPVSSDVKLYVFSCNLVTRMVFVFKCKLINGTVYLPQIILTSNCFWPTPSPSFPISKRTWRRENYFTTTIMFVPIPVIQNHRWPHEDVGQHAIGRRRNRESNANSPFQFHNPKNF